ncbi:B12-binding domain-containing radical SAM protein [Acidobacteria bacterium AH-259-D05]|nr:B12-binding domain-containing radical SAM protein [Acidobacteria bacterium AH-259-D05]
MESHMNYPWQRSNQNDRGKILLIYPVTGMDVYGINVGLPLSCLYLGTVLQQAGYRVEILDERVTSDFEEEVAQSICREKPILAGISTMTGMQIRGGLKAARALRNVEPSLPIVWGGVHPSLCPDSTLKDDLCDLVVVGEGEITLVELADCLRESGDLSSVKGIGYKADGELKFTPGRPMIENLDVIPRPNYDLIKMEQYFTRAPSTGEAQLQMVTSRGCPFDCEFCYNLKFNEQRFRYHSAERTVSDLVYLVERFGVNAVFIEDDYFFGHPGRVEKICDLLLKEKLDLLIQVPCRVDYLHRQNDEMIDKLYRAGFKELWVSPESGSPERLKEILKRTTLEQVRKVNRLLSRSDVYVKYGFMAGFPNETREETLQTVDFMFELLSTNPSAGTAPVAIYTPYPGTTLYDKTRLVHGMEFPDTLEGWSHFHFGENNNPFLSPRQKKFISKINVMSRFFERRAFERFCDNRFKPLLMGIYSLYYRYLRLRFRWRVFGFMPEIPLIRLMEKIYVQWFHQAQLSKLKKPMTPDTYVSS